MKKTFLMIALLIAIPSVALFSQTHLAFLMPKPIEEKFIELPGNVRLNYVEQGDVNGIPVIFLHGYSDSWHSFETVMERLPANIRAIAITQRGHGNSDRPAGGYRLDDFAGDVAAFVKQKNLGPVVIVGHSMGGAVAQRFALDNPRLTKALVIVSSAATIKTNEAVLEFGKEVEKLTDPVEFSFAENFQRATIQKPISEEYLGVLIGESLKMPARVWKETFRGLIAYDYRAELRNFSRPTLIMWGYLWFSAGK